MVSVLDHAKTGAVSKTEDRLLKQAHIGERVAVSRNEQHRDLNVRQMVCTFARRRSGWMQRKTQEHEAANARDGGDRLSLRSHPASVGPASGKYRKVAGKFCSRSRSGSDGPMSDPRRIRPAAASFHIGKLKSQGRNASLRKTVRVHFHARVCHPNAGAMGEKKQRFCLGRTQQQS
jgi:hypothetical protein